MKSKKTKNEYNVGFFPSRPQKVEQTSLTDIENMDPLIEKFVEIQKFKNIDDPMAPRWPFRMLITGASSLGKTNVLLNIILKQVVFDKIYFYIKDDSEDKYVFIISFLESLQKQYNEVNGEDSEKIYEISTSLDDVVKVNDLDKEKQNLIIFDDMVVENQKSQEVISDLFIRARKRNTSVIYQTQNLFAVPQNIRKNCSYVLLFATNKRERLELAKTYATDISSKEFDELYKEATDEPFSFMLIDAKTPHKCLRYRKTFNELLIEDCNNDDYI